MKCEFSGGGSYFRFSFVFFLYEGMVNDYLLVKTFFVPVRSFFSSVVCSNHVSVLASSNPSF